MGRSPAVARSIREQAPEGRPNLAQRFSVGKNGETIKSRRDDRISSAHVALDAFVRAVAERTSCLAPFFKLPSDFGGGRIFNLLLDLQRGFRELDGLLTIAETCERQAHVPQCPAFAVPVADLARNLQLPLVVLDGAAVLAQRVIRQA